MKRKFLMFTAFCTLLLGGVACGNDELVEKTPLQSGYAQLDSYFETANFKMLAAKNGLSDIAIESKNVKKEDYPAKAVSVYTMPLQKEGKFIGNLCVVFTTTQTTPEVLFEDWRQASQKREVIVTTLGG